MSLYPIFQWLGQSPLGVAMRASTWGFAVTQMIHLLALALLGGAILVVDLNLLGWGMRRRAAADLARDVAPLFLGSLIVMVLSGVVLVSEEADKVYDHPAFRIKMLALAVAVVFHFTVHRRMVGTAAGSHSIGVRCVGVCSLLSWLTVGLAGRAIGFL